MAEITRIKPQAGPQEKFLSSNADIVIFGGAAYGGKSFGLLLESIRYIQDPRYNGVIFRRESPQITSGGGLWDTAGQIYPHVGGIANEGKLKYTFPTGAYNKFTHLQYEKDKLNHQGAQYVFIGFDELTHFSETQFWYLLTRNRPPSGCNIRPYCRCTTNPEADSWVRELIIWWIDENTGYAIPDRSGIVRYFTRIDEEIIWVDKDWTDESGNKARSITFIPSFLEDNPLGIAADPMYQSNLQAQDKVTRERLLKGNWNITYKGGMMNPGWFKILENFPPMKYVRYWDRAATEPKDENDDPDWTVGAKCGMHGGELYIEDIVRFRDTPAQNEEKILNCADNDGYDVSIGYEIEPGSAGVEVAEHYQTKILKGYTVILDRPKGNKVERCKPWAALAEHAHVYIKKAAWNRQFLAEIGSFPLEKKDQVDAVSGGYKMLTRDKYIFPAFKLSDTKKITIEWEPKKSKAHMHHYGAMVQLPDMSLWMLEVLYHAIDNKMYVYGCWKTNNPAPALVVPVIISRMHLKEFMIKRLLVSDHIMHAIAPKKAPYYFYRKEFIKKKCRPKLSESILYDESGSIVMATEMFMRQQIIFSHEAKPAAQQVSGWTIDKGKPSKENSAYCEGLLMIISELKRMRIIQKKPPKPRDYKIVRTVARNF
ncbi:MAG: hypothetical protein GY853_14075 [PVC group bacterium]|nr:hypothetical protein [PVC group bacterium]